MILAFFALAWLLGIAAAAFAGADLWPTLAAASLLAAASFAYRPRLSTLLLAAAGCALLVTAVWRYDSALPPATPGGIAVYNDSAEPARFRALVVSEPDERPTSVRYRLSTREVLVDGVWQTSEGGVLMWGPLPPRFKYGDLLVVEGKLQTPPTFDDFDYRAYLARQGVGSLVSYPTVEVLAHDRGNPVRAALIDVRQRLARSLTNALPEPHASLSTAILLGRRIALPQALSDHLGLPASKTCKAVFYAADGEPVFVAIRGDMDVNESKLRHALGAVDLHYMSEDEVVAAGFVPGSAGAVGLKGVRIIADDLLPQEVNLVTGANKPDAHLLNVNYNRDWQADTVADIALAEEGSLCAAPSDGESQCHTPMDLRRGIEMGQVFKLGTLYAEKLGATYLDAQGKQRPAVMGSYGIGTERLLAAIIEANHDERGIIWPTEIAPFQVHLVALQPERQDVRSAAEELYDNLQSDGLAVLYDDREETTGVKFNDADLLGAPLRVTVSPRTMEKGSLEVKRRSEKESELVPLDGALSLIKAAISR
jgi:prolyl-tRNA editing enzyme YbaK/EbsC (Cys-tRNA(Pro) deacylase)